MAAAPKSRQTLRQDVSSILIGTPALAIWLAGGIVTLAVGQIYLCSFFLLLLAIGVLARLWGHCALNLSLIHICFELEQNEKLGGNFWCHSCFSPPGLTSWLHGRPHASAV